MEVRCGEGPDGSVVLIVADDGPGIPPGDRERVFERFWRSDTARSDGSNGLGLSIVRAVAERHGGSARVVDTPGGARFEVRLPGA